MLSRMASYLRSAKSCIANDRPRPDIEVHRLGTHQPFALRSIYNLPLIQGARRWVIDYRRIGP
jgi:hypothetical protein